MGINLFICSINHPNLLFLYRIFIGIYPIAAWILGFVNPKAKQWHAGRKEILTQIAAALASNTKPIIWMHCASLGEFEQGRPVLEGLQKQYPNYSILLTFFRLLVTRYIKIMRAPITFFTYPWIALAMRVNF